MAAQGVHVELDLVGSTYQSQQRVSHIRRRVGSVPPERKVLLTMRLKGYGWIGLVLVALSAMLCTQCARPSPDDVDRVQTTQGEHRMAATDGSRNGILKDVWIMRRPREQLSVNASMTAEAGRAWQRAKIRRDAEAILRTAAKAAAIGNVVEYWTNVRTRAAYCRSYSVDILPFVEAYEETHYETIRHAFQGLSDHKVSADALWQNRYEALERTVHAEMMEDAAASNVPPAALCKMLNTNPHLFVYLYRPSPGVLR